MRRTLPLLPPDEQAALLLDLEAGDGDLFLYENADGERELSAWPLPPERRRDADGTPREELVVEDAIRACAAAGEAQVLRGIAALSRAEAAKPHQTEANRLRKLLLKLESEKKRLSDMVAAQDAARLLQSQLYRFSAEEKHASVTLDGAGEGLAFYLKPNFHNLMYDEAGNFILGEAIYAAMGQAFFTLSLGIGALAIFGSYIGKEHRLMGEAVRVGVLDTCVAFTAGLIIFPACFAYDVAPDSGFGLIFVTLPNVFNSMSGGRLWGALFFVFMSFAALSTITAVFENIISFAMDRWGWSRRKAVWVNFAAVLVLSMPCILGFNLWSGFQPLGEDSNIMALEDFLITDNLLPLGSLVYLLFCVSRRGWGWKNFLAEANAGQGLRFPEKVRFYVTWILPFIVLIIFVVGYWNRFFA